MGQTFAPTRRDTGARTGMPPHCRDCDVKEQKNTLSECGRVCESIHPILYAHDPARAVMRLRRRARRTEVRDICANDNRQSGDVNNYFAAASPVGAFSLTLSASGVFKTPRTSALNELFRYSSRTGWSKMASRDFTVVNAVMPICTDTVSAWDNLSLTSWRNDCSSSGVSGRLGSSAAG